MGGSQNSFIKKKKAEKRQKKQKEKLENRVQKNKLKSENAEDKSNGLDSMMISIEEARALRHQNDEGDEKEKKE